MAVGGGQRGESVGHGFEIVRRKRVFWVDVKVGHYRPCRIRLVTIFDSIILHEDCDLGAVLSIEHIGLLHETLPTAVKVPYLAVRPGWHSEGEPGAGEKPGRCEDGCERSHDKPVKGNQIAGSKKPRSYIRELRMSRTDILNIDHRRCVLYK